MLRQPTSTLAASNHHGFKFYSHCMSSDWQQGPPFIGIILRLVLKETFLLSHLPSQCNSYGATELSITHRALPSHGMDYSHLHCIGLNQMYDTLISICPQGRQNCFYLWTTLRITKMVTTVRWSWKLERTLKGPTRHPFLDYSHDSTFLKSTRIFFQYGGHWCILSVLGVLLVRGPHCFSK